MAAASFMHIVYLAGFQDGYIVLLNISTISNVISTMDTIDNILQSRGDRKLQPAVLRAVALGRATLQRVYQKTDASDIYRLALGSGF
jgi:hypothetical protein